jgi:hypothetical protein
MWVFKFTCYKGSAKEIKYVILKNDNQAPRYQERFRQDGFDMIEYICIGEVYDIAT